MKKTVSILLILAVFLSTLTGCGENLNRLDELEAFIIAGDATRTKFLKRYFPEYADGNAGSGESAKSGSELRKYEIEHPDIVDIPKDSCERPELFYEASADIDDIEKLTEVCRRIDRPDTLSGYDNGWMPEGVGMGEIGWRSENALDGYEVRLCSPYELAVMYIKLVDSYKLVRAGLYKEKRFDKLIQELTPVVTYLNYALTLIERTYDAFTVETAPKTASPEEIYHLVTYPQKFFLDLRTDDDSLVLNRYPAEQSGDGLYSDCPLSVRQPDKVTVFIEAYADNESRTGMELANRAEMLYDGAPDGDQFIEAGPNEAYDGLTDLLLRAHFERPFRAGSYKLSIHIRNECKDGTIDSTEFTRDLVVGYDSPAGQN